MDEDGTVIRVDEAVNDSGNDMFWRVFGHEPEGDGQHPGG